MLGLRFTILLFVTCALGAEFTVTWEEGETEPKLCTAKFTYDETIEPYSGTSGFVIRAKHDGSPCAVKLTFPGREFTLDKEVRANRVLLPDPSVKIEGIVPIYLIGDTTDYDKNKKHRAIKTDLLGVDLFTYQLDNKNIPPKHVCRMISKALLILEKLEAKGVTHRDVKPENLMLEDGKDLATGDIALVDYASAHWKNQLYEPVAGDYVFMSLATHLLEPPHPNQDVESLVFTGLDCCDVDFTWLKACRRLNKNKYAGKFVRLFNRVKAEKRDITPAKLVYVKNSQPIPDVMLSLMFELLAAARSHIRCDYAGFSARFANLNI